MIPTKRKLQTKERNKRRIGGRISSLSQNIVKSNFVSSVPTKRALTLRRICNKKPSKDELIKRFSSFPEVNPMPMVEADLAAKILYMNKVTR